MFLGIIIGLIIGLLLGKQLFSPGHTDRASEETVLPAATEPAGTSFGRAGSIIPPKVYDVLKYVRRHHQPMSGYEGGRKFSNREKRLPEKDAESRVIHYQEWDVNPEIKGQNRGPERLVTGNDGSAWYTDDHYNSFIRIPPL